MRNVVLVTMEMLLKRKTAQVANAPDAARQNTVVISRPVSAFARRMSWVKVVPNVRYEKLCA